MSVNFRNGCPLSAEYAHANCFHFKEVEYELSDLLKIYSVYKSNKSHYPFVFLDESIWKVSSKDFKHKDAPSKKEVLTLTGQLLPNVYNFVIENKSVLLEASNLIIETYFESHYDTQLKAWVNND